ncbi:MAG: permease [Pseudomonadota bacterium]
MEHVLDRVRWVGRQMPQLDPAWWASIVVVLATAVVIPADLLPVLGNTVSNLLHTGVFIAFAVISLAWIQASGAESRIAGVFSGPEYRMILLAAVVGGLAPFCSCEIIPFIAALLTMGVPLSAVMALWLSSPLMDPAMFSITASALGLEFAVAKTLAAISLGLFGGFVVMALSRTRLVANALRPEWAPTTSCCGSGPGGGNALLEPDAQPNWRFWQDADRRAVFAKSATDNALFLFKWLLLAYLLESLMIRHLPAEWVAGAVGGEGIQPILIGALIGGPAYLNGYAAAPLLATLIEQGMVPGAAMAFALAGGVSCIPAAVAVWALVKPRVFSVYIALGLIGSVVAGLAWNAWALA